MCAFWNCFSQHLCLLLKICWRISAQVAISRFSPLCLSQTKLSMVCVHLEIASDQILPQALGLLLGFRMYLHVEFYPHCAFVLDVSRDCFSWKCWASIWPPWLLSRFRPCQHVEFSPPLGALTFVSGDYLRLNLWAWALATLRFPPMSTCWVRPILQKPLFWRLPET